ncbi:MAG: RluA family pseudouridine synthase [Ruminococcus sp.]|uniref:RluA family pseudouridine synthase n=1 Tax=Ruminococcus sp. TaxID=41978 RepID=UPI0028739684|nr:RluA family pseudouridine synthase [Ruminococcus sp.]MBQ3284982.1 RluA family pseudouridine synthase [Ruminococcus sp.]
MMRLEFTVDAADAGVRIDKYLSDVSEDLSRSAASRLIFEENVTVNGEPVKKNYKTEAGDLIVVLTDEPQPVDITPEDIPLEVVYEDGHLLVVNKPKGMVVHPAPGHYSGTLVNALMYHCGESLSGINGELRPGIVHRIDKNTSGLLVVAKSDIAHAGLSEQIKDHSFTREYLAICYGNIKEDERTVDAPIGRHKTDRKKMCVTELNSKPAITHIRVLERYDGFTYILCRLETGRTHQIRVHLAHIGHPIAGDDVYGPSKVITTLGGQCLHAYKLGFIHPVTGEYLEFTADPPESFVKFREKLRGVGSY